MFIGTNIDKDDIRNRLDTCLLTDDEFAQGPDAWKTFTDPIHAWELNEDSLDLENELSVAS